MTSSKQLKYGTVLSYTSILLNIIAGIVYTPWMVAQIGQSDYGLYTLANSLITMFMVDFGLSSATSKYVTQYLAENDQAKVNTFLGAIYKLYLIIDAIILIFLVFLYFGIDFIYASLTYVELEKFKIVYIISASFAVVNFPFVTFNGILNSYEKFVPLKLADVIYRIALIALTVLALVKGYGVYALVVVHALVGLLIIVYKYIIIKKETPVKVDWRKTDKYVYKSIFTFSIWVAIFTLSQRLIFSIIPSILGIVANSKEIAVFGVITTIEGYSYMITSAINGMFIPQISRIFVSGNETVELNKLLQKVGKFQFALNGLIIAGFAVLGKKFIVLWMGESYIEAYYGILLILIPGLFYNSLQIAESALTVKGKVKYSAMVNVCIGFVNVILSFVLSAMYGAVGACISIFVAYIIRAIAMNIIYYKVVNINIVAFVKTCYMRIGVVVIITVICGNIINTIMVSDGWGEMLSKGMAIIGIYGLTLVIVGLNKHERRSVFDLLQKKIRIDRKRLRK